MVPALTPARLTAAAPVKRFVGIWHPHGASPGYWSPLQEGKNFEFSYITKPLERVPQSRRADQRARHARGDGDHRRAGRRPRARRRAAVRRAAAAERGQPVPRRHRRSAHRQQVRPGHDPLVAAAGRRGHRQLRELQLGLQLRLHELDFLVVADDAAADAGESARGRSSGCSATAPARRSGCAIASGTPASSTRSSGSSARSRPVSAPATGRASTPTSRTFASSNGASGSPWTTR